MTPTKSIAIIAALGLNALAAHAQFSTGNTCVSVAGTYAAQAPLSGSLTLAPLAKYGNYPAQVCTNVRLGAGFTSLAMDYTYTAASIFNNVVVPASSSTCLGMDVRLNGGPVYSAAMGQGNFAISLTGASPTGTMVATGFAQADNLQVTTGGQTFSISTPLQQFAATVTLNADGSSDTEMCITGAGVNATVNGVPTALPAPIWQCINPPSDPKQRIRYKAC